MNATEGLNLEDILTNQEHLSAAIDTVWLLLTIFGIFIMQAGFLMLEAGAVSANQTRTIMMKNICDGSIGAIGWYLIGNYLYCGNSPFEDTTENFVGWFQSYVFAITTCTIVSGGVACRIKLIPYLIYSILLCSWIYPVIARWCWGSGEWLTELGYKDFAGSGPVHLIGGVSAGVGAFCIKPRAHRFTLEGKDASPPMSSEPLAVLGMFILWFGWFSFNSGSSAAMDPESMALAIRAAMNTLIGSSCAAITGVVLALSLKKNAVTPTLINSILGGLVCVTGGCAFFNTWSAALLGFISPFFTMAASDLLVKYLIDDPLDAFAVHGMNGFIGVLALGLFDRTDGLLISGDTTLFIAQLVGAGFQVVWSGLHAFLFFYVLGKFVSMRASADEEMVGLDSKYFDQYQETQLDNHAIRVHTETKAAMSRLKNKHNDHAVSSSKGSEAHKIAIGSAKPAN